MYSDKENINILTALLRCHGVAQAVLCPGSRNAPIVHNLHEAGFCCHAVTDERSAGFYALGIALSLRQPVVVCVTSGSALLNLLPAVAEAQYRHVPLVVVSADRPSERIGQLDGQTLPQEGALGCFAGISVSLPEPCDDASSSHCNRLVNEALLAATGLYPKPVHINVPISEPLFNFTVESLPQERTIMRMTVGCDAEGVCRNVVQRLNAASRPMIVVGQCAPDVAIDAFIHALSACVPVLYEPLCCSAGGVPFDDVLAGRSVGCQELSPDFIFYIGDTVVSKRLKTFLRDAPGAETWLLSQDGCVHDTFRNLTAVVDGVSPLEIMACLGSMARAGEVCHKAFRDLWNRQLLDAANHISGISLSFSEEMAVRMFEEALGQCGEPFRVHYANSTSVRLACRYARHYTYVNRGVNGIEGSLSTAAGFSLATSCRVFCVIGDLSFFYDSNALWNGSLGGNLRILLLNNAGGSIFRTLPGLEHSPAREHYVMARHSSAAQGLCLSHDIRCIRATDEAGLRAALHLLVHDHSDRPIVVEAVFD